jgi:AefR-like transcriptional repressor, C-terminal domain
VVPAWPRLSTIRLSWSRYLPGSAKRRKGAVWATFYRRRGCARRDTARICPAAPFLLALSGLLRTLSGGEAATVSPDRVCCPSRGALHFSVSASPTSPPSCCSPKAMAPRANFQTSLLSSLPGQGGALRRRRELDHRGDRAAGRHAALRSGSLEEVLRRLVRLILRSVLMPTALALNRLMVAEAQRFPELAQLDAWADDCVNLFLSGCRFWTPSQPGRAARKPQFRWTGEPPAAGNHASDTIRARAASNDLPGCHCRGTTG